jgi:hypothetical protein
MSETQNPKAESKRHITELPRKIDTALATALGEMVVAYGRLEAMFMVAIKRLEGVRTLEQVIKGFGGMDGTIGNLAKHCKKFLPLADSCEKAIELNMERQNFIHATFAADDKGQYVRFRELAAYTDLEKDIAMIKKLTEEVNSLIGKIDQETGSLLTDPSKTETIIAALSVAPMRLI